MEEVSLPIEKNANNLALGKKTGGIRLGEGTCSTSHNITFATYYPFPGEEGDRVQTAVDFQKFLFALSRVVIILILYLPFIARPALLPKPKNSRRFCGISHFSGDLCLQLRI